MGGNSSILDIYRQIDQGFNQTIGKIKDGTEKIKNYATKITLTSGLPSTGNYQPNAWMAENFLVALENQWKHFLLKCPCFSTDVMYRRNH